MELIEKDNLLEESQHKIEEMDDRLKHLEAENRLLLTQKSQEELERIQLKKQSLTLNLKHTTSTTDVQTDTIGLVNGTEADTTGTETCDTFHTANSECSFASALPSPFPPKDSDSTQTETNESSNELPDDGKTLMSDSGVCLDAKLNDQQSSSGQLAAKGIFDGDNLSTNSSQNIYEQLLHAQMSKLREKIAIKKAEIMKILEMGGEKLTLDKMINDLQELQRDSVKLEIRLENSRGKLTMCFFLLEKHLIIVICSSHNTRWLSFGW